jgi:hypothetical protein
MNWVLGQGEGGGEEEDGHGREEEEEEEEMGLEFRAEAGDEQCAGRIVTNLHLSNNVIHNYFIFLSLFYNNIINN